MKTPAKVDLQDLHALEQDPSMLLRAAPSRLIRAARAILAGCGCDETFLYALVLALQVRRLCVPSGAGSTLATRLLTAEEELLAHAARERV